MPVEGVARNDGVARGQARDGGRGAGGQRQWARKREPRARSRDGGRGAGMDRVRLGRVDREGGSG